MIKRETNGSSSTDSAGEQNPSINRPLAPRPVPPPLRRPDTIAQNSGEPTVVLAVAQSGSGERRPSEPPRPSAGRQGPHAGPGSHPHGRRPMRPHGRPHDGQRPATAPPQSQAPTQGPNTLTIGSGERNDDTPKMSKRSRSRFGMRRPRLASDRRLPPTQLHEGHMGAPEHLTGTEDSTLKFYALGGLGEVGRNMYVLEYKDEIIIIDAGFLFPQDNMPGIDFIVPDTKSLEHKKGNIRALILTHGHMDHIGGIPYIMDKLGNPDIYTALLTEKFVLKRQSEFPHLPKLNMEVVKAGDTVKMGEYFTIEFFNMNHNIPDDIGLFIKTPVGNVVHTADFKFDPNPLYGDPANYPLLEEYGKRGVHTLICESTDAEDEGHSISEATVYENMEIIFKEAKGLLVFGTFSSMINRMQQIVKLSEKYGRKVIFDGYSLKTNVEIAKEIGYMKIDKGTQISVEQVDQYPRDRVTVIATGALGQEAASLMRIVNQEHRHLSARQGDSVVFSSSVIPGNERSVQYLKDMLYRSGVKVYHYQMMDLHAGGHAKKEDLIKIIDLLKPQHLIPHHGQYSMMVTLGEIGVSRGIPEKNIIISDNGKIVHFTEKDWWFDKKSIPINYIMVDGLGVGDIGSVVLRDRQVLAEDGMFVIIALVDARLGQLRGSPDIISRGFIYINENKELLAQVRKKIRSIIESAKGRPMNIPYVKDQLRDDVGKFLFQKTERRPMILPVIIEV